MYRRFIHPQAIAHIQGEKSDTNLWGNVQFFQQNNAVLVRAVIHGLPLSESGFYGFHIHEGTRCTGENFADTGSHYNPTSLPHPLHSGDLPPLMRCQNGAYLEVLTDRFRVAEVIGRTVVIHSGTDDFTSQPAGNAGSKIACGVIQRR